MQLDRRRLSCLQVVAWVEHKIAPKENLKKGLGGLAERVLYFKEVENKPVENKDRRDLFIPNFGHAFVKLKSKDCLPSIVLWQGWPCNRGKGGCWRGAEQFEGDRDRQPLDCLSAAVGASAQIGILEIRDVSGICKIQSTVKQFGWTLTRLQQWQNESILKNSSRKKNM